MKRSTAKGYASSLALVAVATLFVLAGLASLRIAGSIAVSAGYGPVVHLQAFGRPADREEIRRAWRAEERFRAAGLVLLTSSIPLGVFAVRAFRRARRGRPGGTAASTPVDAA